MTVSSFVVPAVGVITSPILARALGADGRGQLAAALAPAALILPVATLGLPDALVNLTAKFPQVTRRALMWASVVSIGLGLACLAATAVALPALTAGNGRLGQLILLATVLVIPSLVLGAVRGAATGRQMWGAIAVERFANAALRLVAFALFFLTGHLSLMAALLISMITPLLAGLSYWRLLRSPPPDSAAADLTGGTLRPLLSFGSRVWFGAVGEMLLGRIGQILMTPLSSSQDLGLYVVASTISDVPLIVALAVQGALFGVNSKSNDAHQIAGTARLTMLVGAAGCVVIGGSLPFWIRPLFGAGFDGALVPTLMLLASAVICIPGLMAAAGLSAFRRPGLRSIGLIISLVANISAFVVLVPLFGVVGAGWTSIISNVVMTSFMVRMASRVMGLPAADFLVPRSADVRRVRQEILRLLRTTAVLARRQNLLARRRDG